MTDRENEDKTGKWVVWLVTFIVTVVFFYAMDRLLMSLQGLPLNVDLTPFS